MTHLRLVPPAGQASAASSSVRPSQGTDDEAMGDGPVVPIRLLLALSGRCSCVECCATELARRAGREWVHPDLRASRPELRAVQ